MKIEKESDYFKVGCFVIAGLIILIVAILVLGSGQLFKKTLYVETYFNESVQGLSVGSPVKYRGLDIGHISHISFINQIYPGYKRENNNIYSRYIYVEIAITTPLLTQAPQEPLMTMLQKDIEEGLRFKLTLQGLTGTAYLELDFLDPKTNPTMPINWVPKHYYIPSAISTLTRVSDNVSYLLGELRQVHIKDLFGNVNSLSSNTNKLIVRTDRLLNQTNQQIKNTITNIQEITNNLKSLSAQAKDYPSQLFFGQPPPKLDPSQL